ncbi:DNA replication licensing factor mcm8 [Podila humilis]|nr:DNA replication licensing factor mcm8 [Podila humilis]
MEGTNQPQYARRGGRGGWRGRGYKNKKYPGGPQNPQGRGGRKRWQPRTSTLDYDQDNQDFDDPSAVVVSENDIPAQALQAQQTTRPRAPPVNCPYRDWDQYLPQHDYHIGHEFDTWIAEFQDYLQRVMFTNGLIVDGVAPPEEDKIKGLVVRIARFDKMVRSKDLKANLIGKLVTVKGTVVRTSMVKPLATKMSFKCNTCQEVHTLDLPDSKFIQPTSCVQVGCRSKQFTPQRGIDYDTTTVDWQTIRLQEKLPDDRNDSGRVPRTIDCEATRDLVDKVIPGDVVEITGIVKVTQAEKGNTMYLLYLDVNYITKEAMTMDEDYADEQEDDTKRPAQETTFKDSIHISNKDMYAIQDLVSEPELFKLVVNSFSPAIFGHEMVKAGILLAMFGGRRKNKTAIDRTAIRSDPHVLVVGDPGLGKSQLLMAAVKLAPRGVYVCGSSGISTSGLTVTLVRGPGSEFALEAGALVLGDLGCCCIDEFDKMTTDHNALLEAMEQQSISIAKAGIICSLPARTSVIAAANPVGGHYNLAKTVSENLKMNNALLSRFDLIFILMDKPDNEMDRHLSRHVMAMHSGNPVSFAEFRAAQSQESDDNSQRPKRERGFSDDDDPVDADMEHRARRARIRREMELPLGERLKLRPEEDLELIPPALLRKYIAYARKYVMPRLSQEAADLLQEFYLMLRVKHRSPDGTPVTTRQLESMLRLAEARARMELREVVTRRDAQDVIAIITFSLQDAFDNSGAPDPGLGSTRRGKSNLVKSFVNELQRNATARGNNIFTRDELYNIFHEFQMPQKGIDGNFQDFVDRLNNQNFLLMKGSGRFQLTTATL